MNEEEKKKKRHRSERELYQRRTYALAVFVILCIFIFWSMCVLAPVENPDLATFLCGGLSAGLMAIIYFFYRRPKKDKEE